LRAAGIEATYLACDVTDPEAVRVALGEVAGRYGRIDGIVHRRWRSPGRFSSTK